MTKFKICGLRDLDNALAAAESGASFLGFVFVEGVRRQLAPELGARLIAQVRDSMKRMDAVSDNLPHIVGLFANQSAGFVNSVARECRLDYAQLCGDETPEFWDDLILPVIRQVKVREDLGADAARRLAETQARRALDAGHMALLDKHEAGKLGGTGVAFDWSIAADLDLGEGVLLAGGLTPDNVAQAISVARPWCVDVSTGVETDGVKDAAKIRAFARSVGTDA